MITAYDKLKANFYNGSFIEINSGDSELIQEIMKDFAELHVKAALKEASENAETDYELGNPYDANSSYPIVDKDSILNAYPLTLIK